MVGKIYITSRSTFFRYLYGHKKIGCYPKIWRFGAGRPSIVAANKIVALTTTPSSYRLTSSLYIRKLLEKEELVQAIEMNGFVPLLFHPNVSDTAVSNYKALAGASSKATIVKVVQHNMDNQQTTQTC